MDFRDHDPATLKYLQKAQSFMTGSTPKIEVTQIDNPLQEPLNILRNVLKATYKKGSRQLLRKDCDKFYNILRKMADNRSTLPENLSAETPLDGNQVVTIIFYKLIAVLKPCPDRIARLREMSNIKINKLYKLISELYKGPSLEEKRAFIGTVAFGLNFIQEDTEAAIREMKFLQALVSSSSQIKVIKDFPKFNVLTERAISMINRLLGDENVSKNLARIYRKLDVLKSVEELEKVCPTEEVVGHLKQLVPERIIKYPFCHEIVGFSCKNGFIALSESLFSLEEGQVDLTPQDCENQNILFFQSLAPLVATILREMAMVYQISTKNIEEKGLKQSSPSPTLGLNSRLGRDLEKELFGDIAEKYKDYQSKMSEDMLKIFFNIESWGKPRMFDGLKDESLPPLMTRNYKKPRVQPSRINNFLDLFNWVGGEKELDCFEKSQFNF